MHHLENILFSRENALNAVGLGFIGMVNILHDVSQIAAEFAPIATASVGFSIALLNIVRTFKELKKK
ncbi:MAG: hypothetical protein IPM95_07035 [Sphingobacteriales bacterium]|jgi:NADH:ubiquinone oxidoreductase subunit K|nr:hypothetical protein [Sphingobacteriales bacterium]